MTAPFVLWLSDVDQEQISLIGGKAANLGNIARWSLPTLDGFCVTTEAYRSFLMAHNLDLKIADILGEMDLGSLDQVNTGSQKIRELIESAGLLPEIAQDIKSAYIRLGQPSVAIRSSATAEDLPGASFAGQHESYLNVIGQDQLLEYIQRCWAALWTPRAIRYRARQGLDNARVYMAVVVQKMIQADVAGVMFTTNPLNNRSDQIVINASYGLGEAIVNGSVTPDTFILNKHSLSVLNREIGSKEVMVVYTPEGKTRNVHVPAEKRNVASLADRDVSIVGTLGKQVEELYRSAQDIEWAWAGGKFYLLQTRPITARQAVANNRPPRYNRLERLLLDFLLDYFPTPPYHFDRSILLGLIDRTLQLAEVFGLRPPQPSAILRTEPDGSLGLVPVLPRLTWRTLPGAIVGTAQALRSLRVDPGIWERERWPNLARQIDQLQARDVREMTDDELLDLIQQSLVLRDEGIFAARMDYILGGWITMGALPLVLKLIGGREGGELYSSLMSGLDHPTAFMNHQLRELVNLAASLTSVREMLGRERSPITWSELETTDEGRTFLEAVQAFLDRFGARTGTLMPAPSMPAWEDNPNAVFSLIEIILRDQHSWREDPTEVQKQQSVNSYARALKLGTRFPLGFFGCQRLVRFLIERTRAMLTERDWIIFAYELATRPIRRVMHEMGQRLVRRSLLIEASDIRFLSLEEAKTVLTGHVTVDIINRLRSTITQRKFARTKSHANWKIFSADREKGKGDVFLKGIAASSGIASGIARIILSENEFPKLNIGELLVCRATNPAWTPLFAIASGVVADTGGPLSHAAIVAREYGIPAVLGTKFATSIMIDGEKYTVDGTRGYILHITH